MRARSRTARSKSAPSCFRRRSATDARRLGRDRAEGHRHQFLFVEEPVHPGEIYRVRDDTSGPARAGATVPAFDQYRVQHGLSARPRSGWRARPRCAPPSLRAARRRGGSKAMRGNAVKGLIGRPRRRLRATRALSMPPRPRYGTIWLRGDPLTERHRVALRIAATWSIHQSASVVAPPSAWPAPLPCSPPTSSNGGFATCTRSAQQIQARDTHFEDAGKAILSGGSRRTTVDPLEACARAAADLSAMGISRTDERACFKHFWVFANNSSWSSDLPCSESDRSPSASSLPSRSRWRPPAPSLAASRSASSAR